MLVLYSSSRWAWQGWDSGCLCWCCIVLVVDMVRLGWWMFMLVLYSSSSGHGKVEMVDAYVGAV